MSTENTDTSLPDPKAPDAQPTQAAFTTETRKLLDLMVHAIYSKKEVFLRELISNASDALDKLRFQAIEEPSLRVDDAELGIQLTPNSEARTLTISDNGIGMDAEDMVNNLGTIARSGTQAFAEKLKEAQGSPELIGQFGVGFYSAFIVAKQITVISRKAGQEQSYRWQSSGGDGYTLNPIPAEEGRMAPGTDIILNLKDADPDDDLQDFTQPFLLRETVKRYSDFVGAPITLNPDPSQALEAAAKAEAEAAPEDTDSEDKDAAIEAKEPPKPEIINSQKAIWTRSLSEIEEDELAEFYKHISHDWEAPLKTFAAHGEGAFEYRALLFVPSKPPMDLMPTAKRGVRLYVKRVFIMEDCEALIPEYLRFVRGVVDAEDLSLNISREILQQDRQIQTIKKRVIKKVLDGLASLLRDDRDKYIQFWNAFGRVIKEGLYNDPERQKALLKLVLCRSSHDPEKWTTLEEATSRMKPGQESLYFICGQNQDAVEKSPHLETFTDKGYEVLFFTDPVDALWLQNPPKFGETTLKSVGKGGVALGDEAEQKAAEEALKDAAAEHQELLKSTQEVLSEDVKEVRLSQRLTRSAACLVGDDYDLSPQLEELMRSMQQEVPKTKRILELNPNHGAVQALKQHHDKGHTDKASDFAKLLYGQAILAEGGTLADPGTFSHLLADLMASTTGSDAESSQADA